MTALVVGQPVACNGYLGTVAAVHAGKLAGMVDVRLPGGLTTVSTRDVCPAAPRRVTEAEWDDALNVLPPVRWYTDRGAETFTVPEPVTDTLYDRYVRIGDKRWVMLADSSDSLQTMVQRIRAEGGAA